MINNDIHIKLLAIIVIFLFMAGCSVRPRVSGSYYGTPSAAAGSVSAGVNFIAPF